MISLGRIIQYNPEIESDTYESFQNFIISGGAEIEKRLELLEQGLEQIMTELRQIRKPTSDFLHLCRLRRCRRKAFIRSPGSLE